MNFSMTDGYANVNFETLPKIKLSSIIKKANAMLKSIENKKETLCIWNRYYRVEEKAIIVDKKTIISNKQAEVLKNISFRKCKISFDALAETFKKFVDVEFDNILFTEKSYWRGMSFRQCEFTNCSFSHIQNRTIQFAGCKLIESQFDCHRRMNLHFGSCELTKCSLNNGCRSWGYAICNCDCKQTTFGNTDFTGCDLYGSNLHDNTDDACTFHNCAGVALVPPEEGAYIGFKKAYVDVTPGKPYSGSFSVIVKLQILASSKRTSATERKCRASKAKVLSITSMDGKTKYKEAHAGRDVKFVYQTGKIVEVKNFDDNRWNQCTSGIHHFITRREAVEY